MNTFTDPLMGTIDARLPGGLGGHWYGVYPAQVTDNQDPDVIGYSLPGRYVLVKWTAEF